MASDNLDSDVNKEDRKACVYLGSYPEGSKPNKKRVINLGFQKGGFKLVGKAHLPAPLL